MHTNIISNNIDVRLKGFGYDPIRWEGSDQLVETILNQVKIDYGFDAKTELKAKDLQVTIDCIKRVAGKYGHTKGKKHNPFIWSIGDVSFEMEKDGSGVYFQLKRGGLIRKTGVVARDYLECSGLWEGDQALVDKIFRQIKSNFGFDPIQTENGAEVGQALIEFVHKYPFPPKDIPRESYQLDSLNIQIERHSRCFVVTMTSKAGELEKIRKQEFGFFM